MSTSKPRSPRDPIREARLRRENLRTITGQQSTGTALINRLVNISGPGAAEERSAIGSKLLTTTIDSTKPLIFRNKLSTQPNVTGQITGQAGNAPPPSLSLTRGNSLGFLLSSVQGHEATAANLGERFSSLLAAMNRGKPVPGKAIPIQRDLLGRTGKRQGARRGGGRPSNITQPQLASSFVVGPNTLLGS